MTITTRRPHPAVEPRSVGFTLHASLNLMHLVHLSMVQFAARGDVCSDAPGRHDAALLARLVLKDGGTLRARLPARPTLDTLFCDVVRDRKTVLKVSPACPPSPCPLSTHLRISFRRDDLRWSLVAQASWPH